MLWKVVVLCVVVVGVEYVLEDWYVIVICCEVMVVGQFGNGRGDVWVIEQG